MPPTTNLKPGMTFSQREAAVWLDIEEQQDYIIEADAILRQCTEKK